MKKKKTMRCVCGEDITNLSCKERNVEHSLCVSCYQKLQLAAKYKRVLLGTKCLCGVELSENPKCLRRGLCISCYSFLQRRIKHGSKESANRILDDANKKCFCGRKAHWHKICDGCASRTRDSAEAIRRHKSLHKRQAICLCGNPTRVVRGICKQCHVFIGQRAREAKKKDRVKKEKLCLCGNKATTRGLCAGCYSQVRYWNNRRKEKKEKKNEQV